MTLPVIITLYAILLVFLAFPYCLENIIKNREQLKLENLNGVSNLIQVNNVRCLMIFIICNQNGFKSKINSK